MHNFLRKYNLPKLTLENRAVLINFQRRNRNVLSSRKLLTTNSFTQEFYPTINDCIIKMLFKLLQSIDP